MLGIDQPHWADDPSLGTFRAFAFFVRIGLGVIGYGRRGLLGFLGTQLLTQIFVLGSTSVAPRTEAAYLRIASRGNVHAPSTYELDYRQLRFLLPTRLIGGPSPKVNDSLFDLDDTFVGDGTAGHVTCQIAYDVLRSALILGRWLDEGHPVDHRQFVNDLFVLAEILDPQLVVRDQPLQSRKISIAKEVAKSLVVDQDRT